MSTRSTILYATDESRGITIHVYWEQVDKCYYMDVDNGSKEIEEQPFPDALKQILRLENER